MIVITKDWLTAAEDDLLAAKKLAGEDRLTNVVAFHCQQPRKMLQS
jgi:HEPN domain-containing protein